jgi:hypothetical protein
MEQKYCRMIAEDYLVALKKCHIEDTIRFTQEDLTEESIIEKDLDRSSLISVNKSFDVLKSIWLNEYKQAVNNEYNQARIEGAIIPYEKMSALIRLLKLEGFDEITSNNIRFSYFDDNDNLCAFTLTVLTQYPSIWFACVTINTTAAADERQLTVFIPEFTPSMLDNSQAFNKLIPSITENMILDEPLLFTFDLLNDYLGYSLNSHFVKYFIEPLFDKHGVIQLDEFNILQESIKNQHSMFALSDEIITAASHRCELNQLLAVFTKLKLATENKLLFDGVIASITDAITNYSPDKYNSIMQHELVKSIGPGYVQSKSRELEEVTHPEALFPKESYELQYVRLTLILGAYPASPLKTEIQKFQQIIEDYRDLNQIVGLNKMSLAKDLNILGDLLMNPSSENFKNYAARIEINEKASKKRVIGGHILTSSAVSSLGGLAAAVTLLSVPVIIPVLSSAGFFAIASSAALGGYTSANKRAQYKSELQEVEKKLLISNPNEWVLSKLKSLLDKNKDGKNVVRIQTVMTLFPKTKASTLNSLCNALAQAVFSLKETDPETADNLMLIREMVVEAHASKLVTTNGTPFSPQMITDNVQWAENTLKKIEENIDFAAKYVEQEVKEEQSKWREQAIFVLLFNQNIQQPIHDLLDRETTD